MLLVWVILGESEAGAKIGHLCGKVTGNSLGWPTNWVGWGGVSVEGGHSKRIIASASTSVWEKALLLALAPMPDNSVFPCMSLVPKHWNSEWVSLCVCPLKGTRGTPESPPSYSASPWCFSQPEVMENFLPGIRTLGCGAWCEPGTPCSSKGTSAPEISLLIFILHMLVWDQPILHLYPSYQSWCGFFFISWVVRLLFR